MRYLLLSLIKFYALFISPLLPQNCRFTPSCSQYSYIAIKEYGAFKGLCLTISRIVKCHPWHVGGFDPVLKKNKHTN